MPGDFSDLDAIRVRGDYYAISSTMQYSAGMAIVYSKDLVNWNMIGHVVPDLTLIDAELNWNKMNRPGRGIWAGAIRYHAKKFWVYFGTPDQGIFMSKAMVPTGPWTRAKRVLAGAGWDDPCPSGMTMDRHISSRQTSPLRGRPGGVTTFICSG